MGEKTDYLLGIYMDGNFMGSMPMDDPFYTEIESTQTTNFDETSYWHPQTVTISLHMSKKEIEKLIRILTPNNWRKMHGYPKRRKGWSR